MGRMWPTRRWARERPRAEKAGFALVREIDDADEDGNVVRVEEWELAV